MVTAETDNDYRDPKNLLPGTVVFPEQYGFPWAKDLGVIRGSFYEMGVQFGEMQAADILNMVDQLILPGILGRFESVEQFIIILNEYKEHAAALSPQWMDFNAGTADGAISKLEKSKYYGQISPFDMIFAINYHWAVNNPPQQRMEELGIGISKASLTITEDLALEEHACNGVWVSGDATTYGQSYTLFHNQTNLFPHYKMIMIPDDPEANVVFVTGSAGRMFQSGWMVNDKGLSFNVLASGVGGEQVRTKHSDFGVETYVPLAHAAWFAKTAKEAVDIMTVGTPEYRDKMGRKTLLRARPNMVAIGSKNEAYLVEFTAHRYAIRRPGDLGEKDGNYMAFANNFFCDYSYDENNIKTDLAMTEYTDSNPYEREDLMESSAERAYTFMWLVKNNYGKIDREMLQYEIAPTHFRYKEDGTKIVPEKNEEGYFVPITSVCRHPSPKPGYLAPSGSQRTMVFLHNTSDLWHVPCWPCVFIDKPWDYQSMYWLGEDRNKR